MNEMRFYSGGQVGMGIGEGGILSFPGILSPSARLHIVNTISDAVLSSEPCGWANIAIIPPTKQRCVFCGQVSKIDVIICPGCQSQVFEDV